MVSWLPTFALKAIGFVRFYRRAKRPAVLPASASMARRFVHAAAVERLAPVNPLI